MEQGSKTKKIITTTTTSINKREEVPVKTSQSLNTESYEYFSQKITTKNNLTESSLQASNQKDENSSLKCTCNQGSSAKKISKNLNALAVKECPNQTRTKMYLWFIPWNHWFKSIPNKNNYNNN